MGRSGGIRPGSGGTDIFDAYHDAAILALPGNTIAGLHPVDTLDMTSYESQFSDTQTATIQTPATMGAALAAACPLWWDGPTYSGSGDLLNSGTAGSGGGRDMVLGAATAAPSFAAGVFTFDGSNDYMAMADNAAQTIDGGTLWIVCTPVATVVLNSHIIGNNVTGTGPGVVICVDSGTATTMNGTARVSGSSATALASAVSAGTKRLYFVSRLPDGSGTIGIATGAAFSSAALTAQVGTINPTLAMTIGARPALSNFFKMTFNAAGLADRPLGPMSLQAIASAYGA